MPADPVKVGPNVYKVLLENNRVRVLEARVSAGAKVPMHGHPACVVYMVRDTKAKFTFPNGHSEVIDAKAGQTLFLDAMEHAVEAVPGPGAHVVIVELK
mgnify:CR=1 FL=1